MKVGRELASDEVREGLTQPANEYLSRSTAKAVGLRTDRIVDLVRDGYGRSSCHVTIQATSDTCERSFHWEVCLLGGKVESMTVPTLVDRQICHRVADLGFAVSPREVRSFREYGVIETIGNGKGGRNQLATYPKGTAEVIAAVQLAKQDPTYKRKFFRAVLIAWARGAQVGTVGLRRAYRQHFKFEQDQAQRLLRGQRVDAMEPDLHYQPEVHRVISAAQLGRPESSEGLGTLERLTGESVREVIDGSVLGPIDTPPLGSHLGLALQRADGTWQVLPAGHRLWDALALAPKARIAMRASREELDSGRAPARHSLTMNGFSPSDLVVAGQVPDAIERMRKAFGENWWISR